MKKVLLATALILGSVLSNGSAPVPPLRPPNQHSAMVPVNGSAPVPPLCGPGRPRCPGGDEPQDSGFWGSLWDGIRIWIAYW